MRLRWFGLGMLAIAIAAFGFGRAPGRHTTKLHADCEWGPGLVTVTEIHFAHGGTCEEPTMPGPEERSFGMFGGFHEYEAQRERMREACVQRIEESTRTAVGEPALAVFAVIGLGALLVALFPRRWVSGAWVVGSASAAVIATVVSVRLILRTEETVVYWPRYVTWGLAGALALGLLGVTIWLAVSEDRSAPHR